MVLVLVLFTMVDEALLTALAIFNVTCHIDEWKNGMALYLLQTQKCIAR